MVWLALLIVLALLALFLCGKCSALDRNESMLPSRMPPWFGPFDAPAPPQKEIPQTLGERLKEKGWVFITSEGQNCDPEDANIGGAMPGAHVINAENERAFALFAGVQEPPAWFNVKTGELIPNTLPREALELLAS